MSYSNENNEALSFLSFAFLSASLFLATRFSEFEFLILSQP